LDVQMAPKYHPTPLSGGDRKALTKELGKACAMANILANSRWTCGPRAKRWSSKPISFSATRPLACFAGIWTNWTSVREIKEGETTNDIFAFLTTEPNAEVGAIHPKAMPVILTTPDEVETWLTAQPDEALRLQRPLPDKALRIVARGVKEDPEFVA
jgi:putative SOS response-associated peptidase YedK